MGIGTVHLGGCRPCGPLVLALGLALAGCGPTPEPEQPPSGPEIEFPQASAGALFASPARSPSLILRMDGAAEGEALQVEVAGSEVEVLWSEELGLHTATVDAAALGAGIHEVQARIGSGDGASSGEMDLVLGDQGVQLTDFGAVGRASSPALHHDGSRLWLTWVDEREGDMGRLWLQEVDGAGRFVGDPLGLSDPEVDVSEASVVWGDGVMGVLYRTAGDPSNELFVVRTDGEVIAGPIALNEDGEVGSFGGDVSFDGEAFVAVARSFDAATEESTIRWLRLGADGTSSVGPVVIGGSGDLAQGETFLPFTVVRVEAEDDRSLVTFVRDDWDSLFDMTIPQPHSLVVDGTGQVLVDSILPVPLTYPLAFEAQVHRVNGQFLPLWTAVSLLDEDLNPPYRLFGASLTRFELETEEAYAATELFQAPHARSEPVVVEHEEQWSVLLWSDERAHVETPEDGKIQLFAATLGEDLSLGEPLRIDHSLVFSSASQLRAQARANTVVAVWIDERNGFSAGGTTPEVFFDTLWF